MLNEREAEEATPDNWVKLSIAAQQQRSDVVNVPDIVEDSTAYPQNADSHPVEGPRYRIGKKIGQGGMEIVYGGWDVQLQRQVAIEIIRDEESTIRC